MEGARALLSLDGREAKRKRQAMVDIISTPSPVKEAASLSIVSGPWHSYTSACTDQRWDKGEQGVAGLRRIWKVVARAVAKQHTLLGVSLFSSVTHSGASWVGA